MNKSKFLRWSLLICVFTIPLYQQLSVKILVALFLLSIFKKLKIKAIFYNSWDILLYILVLIIGVMYSNDTSSGLRVLETNFSFVALPLLFSSAFLAEEDIFKDILISFILGLAFACAVCLCHSIISFLHTSSTGAFFFYQFTSIIDFQPTYFAYYLCFAISVILYFTHYDKNKYPPWISVGLICFFFSIQMLTAGKTAYVAMLLIFSFFILKSLFSDKRSFTTRLTFRISILLLICMLSFNYFDVNALLNHTTENSDYWERIPLWKAALKANPSFLFGVGTGDYKIVLNDYFRDHGLEQYAKSSFNSHNQFIQTFFSNGLLGLLSLILLMGRPLYLSVKFQNVLGIMTFFSFFIYGMTEVFLGRYQGVVFFAFLHQCFISHYNSQNIPLTRKGV